MQHGCLVMLNRVEYSVMPGFAHNIFEAVGRAMLIRFIPQTRSQFIDEPFYLCACTHPYVCI